MIIGLILNALIVPMPQHRLYLSILVQFNELNLMKLFIFYLRKLAQPRLQFPNLAFQSLSIVFVKVSSLGQSICLY